MHTSEWKTTHQVDDSCRSRGSQLDAAAAHLIIWVLGRKKKLTASSPEGFLTDVSKEFFFFKLLRLLLQFMPWALFWHWSTTMSWITGHKMSNIESVNGTSTTSHSLALQMLFSTKTHHTTEYHARAHHRFLKDLNPSSSCYVIWNFWHALLK